MVEEERILKKKEKARKSSVIEGSFAAVQTSIGDNYIAPYALALNANNLHISLLSSIPGLLGPLSQNWGSKLIEKYSRKKIALFGVLFQALTWLPIIILAYLFYKGIWTSMLPLLLIIFFSAYTIFGNLAGPAVFSWMGDLVSENQRGKYFSFRNRVTGFFSLVCTLIAAFLLDFFKQHSLLLLGFVIFFAVAMIFRFISRQLFKKIYEPKLKLEDGYYFSFWQFIKRAPKNNFGKFSIYVALLHFATAIAGPFFAVYMLKDLQFSYVIYIIVAITQTASGLLFMPLLGKFSDKYGNYKLIKLSSIFVSIFPIFWLFSSSPLYLIFVPQLIVGIAWAGFNLAVGNFIYDTVTPQRRGIAVSYYNVLIGIGVFIGATLGGLVAKYATINFMNIFLFLFLISGIARAIVSIIMLPRIKEVREVKKFDGNRALKNLVLRTVRLPWNITGPNFELFANNKFKHKKRK